MYPPTAHIPPSFPCIRRSKSPRTFPRLDRGAGEQGHARTKRKKGRGVSPVCVPPPFLVITMDVDLPRKHAVETTEMLDFLKEIVESVPDPSAGGTIDLEAEAAEGSKRKRGKAKKNGAPTSGEPKRRRKRKGDIDADGAGEEVGGGAKSEPEGDTAMDEDDDRDGCVEPNIRDQDADWREDSPYVPR